MIRNAACVSQGVTPYYDVWDKPAPTGVISKGKALDASEAWPSGIGTKRIMWPYDQALFSKLLRTESPNVLAIERLRYSLDKISESVEIHRDMRGGIPVLKGSRIPISMILAELAGGVTVSELAEDYEIDAVVIRDFMEGLAVLFDRSAFK